MVENLNKRNKIGKNLKRKKINIKNRKKTGEKRENRVKTQKTRRKPTNEGKITPNWPGPTQRQVCDLYAHTTVLRNER